MARLAFTDKRFAGRIYEFALEETTVGRAPNNSLRIDDDSVSAHHCIILVNGPEVIVRELGSTNGTYVGGIKVAGQRPVHSGQTVRFGSVEARIEVEAASDCETATEITAVYAYGRFKRQAQAERTAPPPVSPPAPAAMSSATEDTLLLPKTACAPAVATPPPATPSPRPAADGRSQATVRLGIGIAAILLLAAVLYLIFGRS